MKMKLPYSVGVIAIVVLAASIVFCFLTTICLKSTNQNIEDRVSKIEQSIDDVINDSNIDKFSQEKVNNEIDNLKEEHDLFLNNFTLILSVFAIVVTICTIIMPIYTYNFLQKDQIENFHNKTTTMLEAMTDNSTQTINDLKTEYLQLKTDIENKIKVLEGAEDNFQKWIDEMFSHFDFSDIRIEPIYNIKQNEIDNYYRKAFVEFGFGRNERAIKILDAILLTDPKCDKAWLLKSQIFYSMEQYDSSLVAINTLIKYNDNCNYYYYIRGCISFKAKYYDSAINDFRYVNSKEPRNEQNLVKLAAALHKLCRTREAISFQSIAIECNGNVAQYYADRGIMYHALKEYQKALSDKWQAILLAKNNAQYYGIYSATLFKLKEYEEAIRYANMALEKDAQLSFVYSFRGLSKAQIVNKYDIAEALNDLNKAIDLDSSNHRNYNRRAEWYIMNHNIDCAIKDLEQACKIAPSDPEIMHLYSVAFKNNGDEKSAKEYDEKARQLGYISES